MFLRKHIIGFKVKDIYTKSLERVIFIDLENNENPNKPIYKQLIIELMGKHSNIILCNDSEIIIDSLRHTSQEEKANRDIYPTEKYLFPKTSKYDFLEVLNAQDFYLKLQTPLSEAISDNIEHISDLQLNNFHLDKIISNTFNGISSCFLKSLISKLDIKDISKESIFKIYTEINAILNSNTLHFELTENKKDYFLSLSLQKFVNYNLNFFLDDFYFNKENIEVFKNFKNSILTLILSTLKKYEKRLSNIDDKLQECDNMEKYRLNGELITANLYRLPKRNLSFIELENYYDNNKIVKIELDKKYLPSINAKRFFKKYNKLKNALEIVSLQKQETLSEINYIESIVYEINEASTLDDLKSIYDEIAENEIFKIPKNKQNISKKKNSQRLKAKNLTTNKLTNFNPLKFTIDGYTVLVGRNNKENDYLTLKFAKKSDLWFHTKDIHGSHVILKLNPGEMVQDDTIFEVAKIAKLHSKGKNSSSVRC